MKKQRSGLLASFGFAFRGLKHIVASERNIRIHLLAILFVLGLGIAFHVSVIEWAILAVCAGGVLAAEAINTSIEEIVDLLHPARSERAGRIKDIAAGGVLIMAITAAVAGMLIFLPKICSL